ncbi:uncharacterized protein BcabD6B2_29500 [Babesia caballi]|uniref:Uncharacterized protein n=1 Tax=Babesia caballi TaxID=5871 RepID=A0AAV4LUW4_BABCB|nr:hypothetical protein, conserved [Babesia caballi]
MDEGSQRPEYYWPSIDKYPWHSHQKRFPKPEDIGVELFSEFARRDRKVRTLFEALHPLPLHGVNCLFWKRERRSTGVASDPDEGTSGPQGEDVSYEKNLLEPAEAQRITKVNGRYYITDKTARNNVCYLIKRVDFKLRPFKAKVLADLYTVGGAEAGGRNAAAARLLRENVSPVGSVRGEWRWSLPHRVEEPSALNEVAAEDLELHDRRLYRRDFRDYAQRTITHEDKL